MDRHSSHFTPQLLCYAKDHDIEILAYPPHCTHALQGLDVACFRRMKDMWNTEIKAFETRNQCGVKKGAFAGVFGAAFLQAFTPETVRAAFKARGIVPYNPNIITAEQMKPSKVTST